MSKSDKPNCTVLDHIDKIEVPGDVFSEPSNEYWALVCFRQGLDFLHRQASQCDQLARKRLNPGGVCQVMVFGNEPALHDIPMGLLTCAFHWYAITVCQYVRTIGAIAHNMDSKRPLPLEYVKQVIPEVLAFRDKVAAHLAWYTKHNQDSHAERQASIMPPLTFVNDAFYVGAMNIATRAKGKRSDSSVIKPWSITAIHNRLCQRYWPTITSSDD